MVKEFVVKEKEMLKETLKRMNLAFHKRFPRFVEKWAYSNIPKAVVNINRDYTNHGQKRVLISYLSYLNAEIQAVGHPCWFQYFQIIHYFVNKGYCVDLCPCNDIESAGILSGFKYDIVIGFGDVFKKIVKSHSIPLRILFLTENNPVVVEEKYKERLNDFKRRHPHVKVQCAVKRDDCFDEEQLLLANYVIHMNSVYNSQSLSPYFDRVYLINSNAILNPDYVFDEKKLLDCIDEARNRFLWFGSDGFIHKGVDLLLDAMKMLPEVQLDLYGISKSEVPLFNALKSPNTHYCGRVNVQSEAFIDQVVYSHNFMVFPSCSEGMSTSVATCMAHGIIPIVSKETGFDPNPYITVLEDVSVENIVMAMKEAACLSTEEIVKRRRGVYEYARKNHSIENFTASFNEIMESILEVDHI